MTPPPRRNWRRWKLTRWMVGQAYVLGIVSGSCHAMQGPHGFWLDAVYWRGKRPYILGWDRNKWGCLLRRRHWPYWPDGRPVFQGLCGRCVPWPCCGSIELYDHAPTCTDSENL